MIALADRRQIHCYYVQDTCCDTSLDVIDSKHGLIISRSSTMQHSISWNWKQLDPVQFDGEMCLCRTIPFSFSLFSNLPVSDACPSSATVSDSGLKILWTTQWWPLRRCRADCSRSGQFFSDNWQVESRTGVSIRNDSSWYGLIWRSLRVRERKNLGWPTKI
jgi:hypothetical protein